MFWSYNNKTLFKTKRLKSFSKQNSNAIDKVFENKFKDSNSMTNLP